MATKQNSTGEAPRSVSKAAGKAKAAAESAPVKRKVGRPAGSGAGKGGKSADLTVGREMLIDVTCNLLKTIQPATITRALVARETGVDPSLIRYYFRNRSALLAAAAMQITEHYAEMLEAARERSDGSPASMLRERIRALINLMAEFPFFHRLITEEIMPSDEPEAREMFSRVTERGTLSYDAILKAGVDEGVFEPSVNRTMLFTAIIGMSEFYAPGLRVIREADRTDRPEPEIREQYIDFVCDLILNGIVKR